MKIIKAIKAWYGYADAQRAKDEAFDNRPNAFAFRAELLPDIHYWHNAEGNTSLRCLCGYGGGWPGISKDNIVNKFVKQHKCYKPRFGGVHREENFPMRNNAMLVVHRIETAK